MIINLSTARENAIKIKTILKKHPSSPHVDMFMRDYIACKENSEYNGEFKGAIKELATKTFENKRYEISQIIQEGIFELLDHDCGITND